MSVNLFGGCNDNTIRAGFAWPIKDYANNQYDEVRKRFYTIIVSTGKIIR